VRAALDEALAKEDFRWALELGSWLVRKDPGPDGRCDGGAQEDRNRLAQALRGVAYATPSANVRNWCLTRALELEGSLDLSRFRRHRFSPRRSPPIPWPRSCSCACSLIPRV
jgi:alkyl sulfatase BDS1-like metallo-beta-lactamase superfamily hydrolase